MKYCDDMSKPSSVWIVLKQRWTIPDGENRSVEYRSGANAVQLGVLDPVRPL